MRRFQRDALMLLSRYATKQEILSAAADLARRRAELRVGRRDLGDEAAAAEERSLSASLEEQKNAAMDLDRKSASYTVLEREAETNRQVYQQLLQQEKDRFFGAYMQKAKQTLKINVRDEVLGRITGV